MSRFASVTTKDELTALNTHLSSVSYIDGWTPSSTDADVFAKFKQPPSAKDYAHVARWYKHVESFSKDERAKYGFYALYILR
jgi:elongation factor 1-beta